MSAYLLHRRVVVPCCLVAVLSAAELDAALTVYDFSTGAGFDQFAYRNSVPRSVIPATPDTTASTAASVSSISINLGKVK